MAKTDTETKAPETKPPETKAPAKQLILGAALLLGMVVGSASAAVVIASIALRPSAAPASAEPEAPAARPAKAEKGDKQVEFAIEDALIVNVRETNQRRYLSVKPVFAMANNDALEEIKKKQGELQNLLIGILKAKTLDELDDPEITSTLGREIQELANANLGLKEGILRVYFTQLVVQ